MKFATSCVAIVFLWLIGCSNSAQKNVRYASPPNRNVPYLSITTEKEIEDEPKTKGIISIKLKDSTVFKSNLGIEFRGAFSQLYDKKSYGFELKDKSDKDTSLSILGLPKNSDWILHGPFGDKTLLRNAVAYKISNNIGKYAAKTAFVEVEINGEYQGLYVLMEKLKQGSNRINVSKLTKKDTSSEKISGGYILKIDKVVGNGNDWDDYNSKNSFPSKFDPKGRPTKRPVTHFMYEYPKAKNITQNQAKYIQNYIAEFENALASTEFKDTEKGYEKYIDTESFIDYFILTELMQNHDGYRISTYLQKDRNQKLKMGPIWDFDIAFGSDNGFCSEMNSHAWVFQYNQYCGSDPWLVPFWWKKLIQDEKFKAKLRGRWNELRKTQLADNQLDKVIDDYSNYITESGMVKRNFEKWNILNKRISPNSTKGSHEKEISRMKSWLTEHAAWIDENMTKL